MSNEGPPHEGFPAASYAGLERGDVVSERPEDAPADPEASPFALPPIEGLPFDRDSGEAMAIRRVIEEADRERSPRDAPGETPPSVC